ncbi:MAG: (d)CMP kinase, partial [Clostridia bacterium]|nr:(d)CMP kinase [Clostridia bacterium]
MKAIRGATTVAQDTPEQIRESVKELLNGIVQANGLNTDRIICIMFSSTADLKSYYPAKAAREAGFSNCALYSSLEPEIDGSLKNCIRVMLLAESDKQPEHVYLNGAKNLRKDVTSIYNIAVDGPAGSGKSTVCKLVAKKLGILYLDTGAMYRAIAYKCVKDRKDYGDKDVVKHIINKLDLKVEYKNGRQVTLLDGEDVSELIRTPQVSMLASYVSAYSFVRTKMVALQREIAQKNSCILDGRDIGTNVLPHCKFKFYLNASPEVRAKRRFDEDKAKGVPQSYEQVLRDINERDFQDKNRAVAPLLKAKDAIEIDTSNMTIDEVVCEIISKIQE